MSKPQALEEEIETPEVPERISPFEAERKVLLKQLADLDTFHYSLSNSEQVLRESIWLRGRDEVKIKLADIRLKEINAGIISADSKEPTYDPVRPLEKRHSPTANRSSEQPRQT